MPAARTRTTRTKTGLGTRTRLRRRGVRETRTPVEELEFIGCEPVHVSEAEVSAPGWNGRRLEYWQAETETAWVVREAAASPYHSRTERRLSGLVERICQARGSGSVCYGDVDLRIREADGTLTDIMQADETIFLHPAKQKLPTGNHLIVGEDDLPDVVLEVDNTTDVRRGKLLAYAEWGFPELWVAVPEVGSPSRPRRLLPGLTIYVLEDGAYRESPESRAFPTWTAGEIHHALNESGLSDETHDVLWRVGRELGEREGTRPEDDTQMKKYGGAKYAEGIAEGHAAGHAKGHAEGRAEGLAEGRAEGLAVAMADTAWTLLMQRGIEVSVDLEERVRGLSPAAVIEAIYGAESEEDFLARLGASASGGDGKRQPP